MRSTLVFLCLALAACNAAQEVASTPPAPTPIPETSTTGASTTITTSAPGTTTSIVTTSTLPELKGLSYQLIGSAAFPVQVVALPGAEISYVVSKDGTILALNGDEILPDPVLDISSLVRNQGEQGLLAAALHPTDDSRLFVHYTNGSGDTVIAEYQMGDPLTADPDSAKVLLELDQPAANHNGGMVMFDSDGSLVVGLGDGGGANDRFGNGQNTSTLLGGLVSLDVDNGEAELFNYGLRNPWRFWIDGWIVYIADVGQGTYEEVNAIGLEPDLNFGWPITEGLHCFDPPNGCDTSGITLPVVEVSHSDSGTCSITGGIVYRGQLIPELNGHYFYSDYCGGYLRSFRYDGEEAVNQTDWTDQVGVPGRVTGFGADGQGEMYVTTEQEVLRVVPVR